MYGRLVPAFKPGNNVITYIRIQKHKAEGFKWIIKSNKASIYSLMLLINWCLLLNLGGFIGKFPKFRITTVHVQVKKAQFGW